MPNPNVAVHEAGHAVMAHTLGLPFRYITMRPHGTPEGKVKFRRFTLDDAPNRHRWVRVLLAGPAAQALWCDGIDPWEVLFDRGGHDDMTQIIKTVDDGGDWNLGAILDEVIGCMNRPDLAGRVGLVADALVNRTNALTYRQYLALISSR